LTDSSEDLRKWRLPRGRHGLPREIVTRSQRERLLAAVVRVTAAKGYEATTVADILEEAGVGRESFYELFEDKRDCMLAAHAILVDDLETKVRAAYIGPGPWLDRVRDALAALLEWFSNDPAAARFTLIELAAVGPVSRARFQAEFSRFIELVNEGLDGDAPRPDLPRAASLAVSAALARIYEEVVQERPAELSNLLPELTYELLVPFLGEEVARAEQDRAAASDSPAPSEAP
jgi:AcrR family transcriptional regulator